MSKSPVIHRRHLPHTDGRGCHLFLTYRLHGTLPRKGFENIDVKIEVLKKELSESNLPALVRHTHKTKLSRLRFFKMEKALHHSFEEHCHLSNPDVARMVLDSILYRDTNDYHLICCCIMPNHVHQVIFLPFGGKPLSKIMQSLKCHTALQANKILNRSGPFWLQETFDREVRDGTLERTIRYTMNNPVKAGLATNWRHYRFKYLSPQYTTVMDLNQVDDAS